MDNNLFLQRLRDLPLEEGKAFIQEHIGELADHASIGVLIKEESQLQEDKSPSISLKLAELLIFFGEYVHHAPSHALGLMAKGNVFGYKNFYQPALEWLDAAGDEFLLLSDEVGWARSRLRWIISAARLGRIEEALHVAGLAREAFLKHNESLWACRADNNMALIYEQMGWYQEALTIFDRLLTIFPTLTQQNKTVMKLSMAVTEMNRGECLYLLGKFEEATRSLLQAQSDFMILGYTGFVINIELMLADLDYIQGYYSSALRRYYQARDSSIHHNLEDLPRLAWTSLRMASCLVKLGRADEACLLAAKAVEAYRHLGVALETAIALKEYAMMLAASHRAEEAVATLNEAWTLFNQGSFDHYAFETKLQQAELMLGKGNISEVYIQAHGSKRYFEDQGAMSNSLRAGLLMASALIEKVRQKELREEEQQQIRYLQEAELLCKETSNQAKRHNLQEQSYKSQYLLGQIAAMQNNYTQAARHYRAAIAQIERILDGLVYDLSPSFLHTTWTVYEEMIALCLQQGKGEQAFTYLERARSMALRQYLDTLRDNGEGQQERASSLSQANRTTMLRIQHELQECQKEYHSYSAQLANSDVELSSIVDRELLQNELKRCEAKLSELFERLHLYQSDVSISRQPKKRRSGKVKSVNVAQIRQHLLPDQTLLEYFVYKGKLIIFAITADKVITYEHADGETQLERLLPLLHAHLQPGGWPDSQRPPQAAIRGLLNKLYKILVAPVAAMLPPPSGYLTIVPYGPLHRLPFHTLYDGQHFLIEDFQINYLPTSHILIHLAASKNEEQKGDGRSPLKPPIVFGYSAEGHLQRAIIEAKVVAELLKGECYLESEATIAKLIEQAEGSSIIHIATHGHSRLDAPNFSYVRLADGQFNAIDAFSLKLACCELVTLSGCETGLALSSGGDEQLGLGRAFLAAGAKSLVMSHWPVEDQTTSELMQCFYQRLLHGDSKVQALRNAQCHLLRGTSQASTHPYFWAAFHLVGDVGLLPLENHQ
jgi:CHAT domain-containing protein/tetratricopeptide (TPR) repeat protein